MPRLAKGTILTITDAYRVSDLALRTVQAFAISNPTVSPDNGAPELVKALDAARRKAFGSKLTLVYCDCRQVNPHVTVDLRTECCGSDTLTVCA